MKSAVKTVKLSEVRFDEDVYPRKTHDPKLVQRYAECLDAIEARENFICVSTDLRILDGRHRQLAYQTAYPDEPDREVSVRVYPVEDNDACADLAAELNSTSGWQLTDDDKRRCAVRMYNRAERRTQEDIARILGARLATVNAWLTSIVEQEQKAREETMYGMWMACHGRKAIADAVGLSVEAVDKFAQKVVTDFQGKENTLFRDYEESPPEESGRRIYSVWNFSKATNEVRHFGNIPPEIIDNLLYLYTEPFDVVFDPFGGGGSTIDICLKRKRRYYVSDLTPIPARNDIRQHDITAGLPKDLPVPDLVFLDPPYWKQAEKKYSEQPTDLANMELKKFLDTIGKLASNVKRKWSGAKRKRGTLAIIIGPWKDEGKYLDLAFLCYQRIAKYLPLRQRMIVPYSTEVHGGAYVKNAKQNREVLYLHRDLMVFGLD